ncbi:hypothetical protein Tco_0262907 [Tanacetum coccineum]
MIENKSKVRTSRNRPVVAKVSTNTSTSGLSPDVAALTDAVKALLLKTQPLLQLPLKRLKRVLLLMEDHILTTSVLPPMATLSDMCTDILKITRKQSKTGKHGHGKRKSTKEAKDSKPQSKKVNLQLN